MCTSDCQVDIIMLNISLAILNILSISISVKGRIISLKGEIKKESFALNVVFLGKAYCIFLSFSTL